MGQSFSNLSPFSRDHIMAELRIDQTRSVIRNGQTNITFRPALHYKPWLREKRERDDFTLPCAVSRLFFFPPLKTAWARNNSVLAIGKWFFRRRCRRAKSIGPDCKLETIGECHDEIEPLSVSRSGETFERQAAVMDFFLDTRKGSNFYITPTREAKLAQTAAQQKAFECFVEDEMRNAKLFSCSLLSGCAAHHQKDIRTNPYSTFIHIPHIAHIQYSKAFYYIQDVNKIKFYLH
jgi:hypothetical protein